MRNTCILAALLALASCTIQAPTEPELSGPKAETAQAIIPGVLNVEFSEEMTALLEEGLQTGCLETKSPGLNSAFSSLGVTSVERIFPDAGEWEPRHREAGLHRWYRVRFSPEIAVTKASNDFYGIPGVISAEPKRRIKYQAFFNDPYSDKQWSLYNPGTPASTHKAGIDINVYPVWERFTAGSNDVIVAVMDGGVQLDHPDLKAITLPAGPDGSKCFVDGYSGYSIPADDHGTHCAGIIAAVNDNGVGISGIAGGRKGEPGSVFKTTTLTTVIEDGFIHSLDDKIPSNHGYLAPWRGNDNHIIDYEREHGGAREIPIIEGFKVSSNYMFRYLAVTNYRNDPKKFLDHLYQYKLGQAFDFDLDGLATPTIPSPDSPYWSATDLGQVAMGYSVAVTPLHIITFYNALANDGKMMKPYLVEDIEKDGVVKKKLGPSVLNAAICSKATADTITRGLKAVIEEGTARRLRSAAWEVAGKTGTSWVI
ncbi:MAG: S8 family serine peptidase, partial [Bacteroidales bacterium]|nr:S8 family serine peptidase [Bacteroidales bacterium]